MPNGNGCSDTSREKEFIMWNVECGMLERGMLNVKWSVGWGMIECGHAGVLYAHRSQRNTDASGVLANNTDCAIGAADEHGFFTGGVQLICGDR